MTKGDNQSTNTGLCSTGPKYRGVGWGVIATYSKQNWGLVYIGERDCSRGNYKSYTHVLGTIITGQGLNPFHKP